MCITSFIGDHYSKKWGEQLPQINPFPTTYPTQPYSAPLAPIKPSELEALKKEVEDVKELLKKAIQYDKDNNQPHCEMEEKIALLKRIGELVGVDIAEVFK